MQAAKITEGIKRMNRFTESTQLKQTREQVGKAGDWATLAKSKKRAPKERDTLFFARRAEAGGLPAHSALGLIRTILFTGRAP